VLIIYRKKLNNLEGKLKAEFDLKPQMRLVDDQPSPINRTSLFIANKNKGLLLSFPSKPIVAH
jgi:hypothetical protein